MAGLTGYNVHENMSQTDIINKIVDRILLEINPLTLDVAKYPVGLDPRVKALTTLLSSGTEGVIRIGIHGMGGVGKTTLAKAVYNQNIQGFQGSCFLANVREVLKRENGLVCLQQKLMDTILKRKSDKIDNVDQGIELIRARICSKKVLIVIDDLDSKRPLEFLEGPFALGSIIIITTRNEDLLDSIKVEAKYKVNELGDAESCLLFAQHAFGDIKIPDTFMELSREILGHAGGLPLALKVFGSNLLNQPVEEWSWFIDKLKRVSIEDVENKLAVSFEALNLVDPMLQNFYLDIACFFIGYKKEIVAKIMETCYTFVDHNFDILRKRCLLTTNGEDELQMHDLLRDMGKKIARNNSFGEPGKHSRLWASKDICDVLKNNKGAEAIEGIIPRKAYYRDALMGESFTTEAFKNMCNLRFLYLKKVNLTGSFEQTFENLRWLYWEFCTLNCLPSDFDPQKLVILELPHSNMRSLWELNKVSRVFEKLKTLNMSFSQNLSSTPDFTKLPCLEILNFESCKSLEELHISIGSLVSLVCLNLNSCVKLRSLPDTICDLTALKVLNISQCSSLGALPTELGNIESLEKLFAWGVPVSVLSDSIGRLSKLVELIIRYNKNIETLPDTICNLRSLEILDISGCETLDILPDQLWKLTRLKKLYACGILLEELPDIDSNQIALSLQNLDLSNSCITAMPSGISQLLELHKLDLIGCCELMSIEELPPNLRRIIACGCISLERLPNLSNLKQLEILDLTNCSGLTEILSLEVLTSLRELYLGGCSPSLLAYTFTKSLFQIYSEFGHQIIICIWSEEFPKWISQGEYGTTMSLDLAPNMAHNYLGMILCFKCQAGGGSFLIDYSLKTSASNFIKSDTEMEVYGAYTGPYLEEDLRDQLRSPLEMYPTIGHRVSVYAPQFVDRGYAYALESGVLHGIACRKKRALLETYFWSCFSSPLGRLGKWRSTLTTVADLSGYSVPKNISGHVSSNPYPAFSVEAHNYHRYQECLIFAVINPRCGTLETEVIDWGGICRTPQLCTNMSLGRRRRSRLIDNSWVYNWTKKKPECITINDDGHSCKSAHVVSKGTLLKKKIFENLKWLRWDCCPFKYLPSDFYPQKLVILELPHSNIRTMWQLNKASRVFEELKTLNMSYSHLSSTPDFTKFPSLETLNLEGCESLEEIDMSIGSLSRLVSLTLRGCVKLKRLPDTICNLRALKILTIDSCISLEALPIKLGNIESLTKLNASGLNVLKLPNSIRRLSKLVELNLKGNKYLENLPHTICNLRALQVLDIGGCSNLDTLPTAIGSIKSLRELNAEKLAVSNLLDSIGY
ncbi:hypothetical protein ACET3Z_006571 [Daucus carota]